MNKFSYLNNSGGAFIEELYLKYQQDPASVDSSWRKFFEGYDLGSQNEAVVVPSNDKEVAVMKLIDSYRARGHLIAETNPILKRRVHKADLELAYFGLSEADLETEFEVGHEIHIGRSTLRNILAHLRKTYCCSVGAEYRYIPEPEIRNWINREMEPNANDPRLSREEKLGILKKLAQSTGFENFLQKKYGTQKRFSLEGGESFIPGLHTIVQEGAKLGIKEFVMGMAHRGRLNVLVTIFEKSYHNIFSEFDGVILPDDVSGDGDVKYHKGHSVDIKSEDGHPVHLSLVANPSHLEAVNPLVHGSVRAKGEMLYGNDFKKIIPIIIHGDAAISGQGVNYEVANMSKLEGYSTGGAIHLVINNQVGFTAGFRETRSSLYCTDIAKINNSPVFHVMGDDPEAVVHVCKLAILIRQKFAIDVYIDVVCYRRYGHNEGDEPRFTQPLMYKRIADHPSVLEIYIKKMLAEGVITAEEADRVVEDFDKMLQEELKSAREKPKVDVSFLKRQWKGLRQSKDEDFYQSPETGTSQDSLDKIAQALCRSPENFSVFPKMEKITQKRWQNYSENKIVDWAMAELLAYGSLMLENIPVRVSGQDSRRGTFGHRHAVFVDFENENIHIPLNHIEENQASLQIYNSHLSEYGVLGFEYGYSLALPSTLVIWEAQFGDFVNGAQIILDQFISSSESKWQRMSGIVLLLPHGYEGQGPEHSSARITRFIGLCAENNMYLINATTPANFYHALRRQIKSVFRKPLVVMSPKSLLRHPLMYSPIEDFTKGRFLEILDETQLETKSVKRLLLCSGKVYYELLEMREKEEIKDIAIVRIEQFYPIPKAQDEELLKKYAKVKSVAWVQEEAINMGAWDFIRKRFEKFPNLEVVARRESASPATGSMQRHLQEQEGLLKRALTL